MSALAPYLGSLVIPVAWWVEGQQCEENMPIFLPVRGELVLRVGCSVLHELVRHALYFFCLAVWIVNEM